MRFSLLLLPMTILVTGLMGCAQQSDTLKINGSTTVNPPVSDAAAILRKEQGLNIRVDVQGGSSGGISMLADGLVHIGMSSKTLSEKDRVKFPNTDFREIRIGGDAVALVVSKDVWEGGITSITQEQMQQIYEGKVKNWQELGGPNLPIVFFNKEPGRGTWSVFAKWLYGSVDKTPRVSFPEVGANEEARNKVGSTPGAMTQLSYSWADGKKVFPLAIGGVKAAPETIRSGNYPMSRPLFLLTDGEPTGNAKVFTDFMLGPVGQDLVRKYGYLGLAELDGT